MAHLNDIFPWEIFPKHNIIEQEEAGWVKEASNEAVAQSKESDCDALADAIHRAATEAAKAERKHYQAEYEEPHPNDIIISDDDARFITPFVREWRTEEYRQQSDLHEIRMLQGDAYKAIQANEPHAPFETTDTGSGIAETWQYMTDFHALCEHQDGEFSCGCILPLAQRRAGPFMAQKYPNICGMFERSNAKEYFNNCVMRSLLLAGRLEPILKAAASPLNNLRSWYDARDCADGEQCRLVSDYYASLDTKWVPDIVLVRLQNNMKVGWHLIYRQALRSYISLNCLYQYPHLREHPSGPEHHSDSDMDNAYETTIRYFYEMGVEVGGFQDAFNDWHEAFYHGPTIRQVQRPLALLLEEKAAMHDVFDKHAIPKELRDMVISDVEHMMPVLDEHKYGPL